MCLSYCLLISSTKRRSKTRHIAFTFFNSWNISLLSMANIFHRIKRFCLKYFKMTQLPVNHKCKQSLHLQYRLLVINILIQSYDYYYLPASLSSLCFLINIFSFTKTKSIEKIHIRLKYLKSPFCCSKCLARLEN